MNNHHNNHPDHDDYHDHAETEVIPGWLIRVNNSNSPIASKSTSSSSSSFSDNILNASRPKLLSFSISFGLILFFLIFSLLSIGYYWIFELEFIKSFSINDDNTNNSPLIPNDKISTSPKHSARDTWFYLPLLPLPPIHSTPFDFFIAHPIPGLIFYLFRNLICRPLWHLIFYWHCFCSIFIIFKLIFHFKFLFKFKQQQQQHQLFSSTQDEQQRLTTKSPPLASASSSSPPPPSSVPLPSLLFILLLHSLFWFFHTMIFGWPSVYLLTKQLNAKYGKKT